MIRTDFQQMEIAAEQLQKTGKTVLRCSEPDSSLLSMLMENDCFEQELMLLRRAMQRLGDAAEASERLSAVLAECAEDYREAERRNVFLGMIRMLPRNDFPLLRTVPFPADTAIDIQVI